MTTIRAPQRGDQRGAVAVETALIVPILILLVLGGVHFGRVLMLRHDLGAATDTAVRSAAISRTTSASQVRSTILGQLGGRAALCTSMTVSARSRTVLGVRTLEVDTVCRVNRDRLSTPFTKFLGPQTLSVSASMPMTGSGTTTTPQPPRPPPLPPGNPPRPPTIPPPTGNPPPIRPVPPPTRPRPDYRYEL